MNKNKKRRRIESKDDAIGNKDMDCQEVEEEDDKTKYVVTSNTENESGDVESDNEALDNEEVENKKRLRGMN